MNTFFAILLLVAVGVFIYRKITAKKAADPTRHVKGDFYTIDDKYNAKKSKNEKDVDRVLDKILESGVDSLNEEERQILREYSGRS